MKKTMKKIVALGSGAALLVSASVMGTMAWLTDTDKVNNTFTVGNVELLLDEEDTDGSKTDVTPDSNPVRDKANEYHLLPGHTFNKDPMVTVKAGSEEAYVRMLMTVHNASAVQTIIDKHLEAGSDFSDLLVGWDETKWLYEDFTHNSADNTIAFEFRYYTTVDGYEGETATNDELEPLFTGLIVPGGTTNAELTALYGDLEDEEGDFKIDIVAHAIQTAGFEREVDPEEAAWTAFDGE